MTPLVIDASVAIKWVVPESGSIEAAAIRKYQMLAPDLLTAECANILWKKVRRNELSVQEAQFAARLLQHADVELLPMRSMLSEAFGLAASLDHPAYDCIYLVCARAVGAPFVTADEALCAKLRRIGYSGDVIGLRDAPERLGRSDRP